MVLTSALKRICDISFYMTFATLLAWMFGGGQEPGLIITLPIFMISAFFAAFLADRYENVRFLAIIPLFTVFLVVSLTTINVLALAPAVTFMVYNLPKKDERGSKIEYQRVFQVFVIALLIIAAFFVLASFITRNAGMTIADRPNFLINFSNEVLIFAFSFLLNTITYLRMIRHDIATQKHTRFRIMNSLPLISVIIGAVIVSSEFITDLVMRIISFIWFNGIWALFTLFAHIITFPIRYWQPTPIESDLEYTNMFSVYVYEGYEYLNDPTFVEQELNNVFAIFLILLVIIGVIVLFRNLSKKFYFTAADNLEEEISFLGKDNKRKRWNRHENQIRATYQKFLKSLKQNKFPTPSSATSLEIEKIAATKVSHIELEKLRQAYINVRYGNREYSRQDVAQAKDLYKQIKIELEK